MIKNQDTGNEELDASSVSKRALRYKAEVQSVIAEVGEHPLFEFKRCLNLTVLADRIEFVKDVQSICTSRIENEKFLVIGVDISTKTFSEITNFRDLDEANIRQILGKYLEPVPAFEIFNLICDADAQVVLFVFPKQPTRRILAKCTIEEPINGKNKLLLREGDLWTKGDSTSKRLATPSDWDAIYEDAIEREAERRTRQRTAHFLERAIGEERLRSGYAVSTVPSFTSDQELALLIQSLCATEDYNKFRVLLEQLRDDVVEEWHQLGISDSARTLISPSELLEEVGNYKRDVFLPGMQKLRGILLHVVKNSGPVPFLESGISLLQEVFQVAHNLKALASISAYGSMSQTESQHNSHTVPALEALISLHILGAYIFKRARFTYLRPMFNVTVDVAGADRMNRVPGKPFTFWPLVARWGEPEKLNFRGGRIRLCKERIQGDPALRKLFGSDNHSERFLCSYDSCIEFNSFLAVKDKTPETADLLAKAHPQINFDYWDSFTAFSLGHIVDTALLILKRAKNKDTRFLQQILWEPGLAPIVAAKEASIIGPFLFGIEVGKAALTRELGGFYMGTEWPAEIKEVIEDQRAQAQISQRNH